MRGNGPYYWSAIVVCKDSSIKSVRDLEGKTIAWVDKNSAADYVFPGFDFDKLFVKQTFAGRHDAGAVFLNQVQAGGGFA